MTFCCGVSPGGAGPAYLRIGLLLFRLAFAKGPVAVNRVASIAERDMSCNDAEWEGQSLIRGFLV